MVRGHSFIKSYKWGVRGVSQSMTHYDREEDGVWTIIMYDNDRDREDLKDLNIMAKFKQETHKKGDVSA